MGSVEKDANADDVGDDVFGGDTRLEFIGNYVLKSLRVNEAKWNKMYKEEENKTLIQR